MFTNVRKSLARRIRAVFTREEGASLVEYALLVALIAVVCITAVTLLGGNIRDKLNQIATAISGSGT
jgi:pilus assembly protein Flp/PilA